MTGTETLAARLGTTVHKSVLLRSLARRGLKTADSVAREAQRRGLDYYIPTGNTEGGTGSPTSDVGLEELVVALIHPCLPWEPQRFRLAAALMAAPGVDPVLLANLAVHERAVLPLADIGRAGKAAEPGVKFWTTLLSHIPFDLPVPAGVMPHPSRYMVIPGKVRPGATGKAQWVRPRMLPAG
ncbi:hypothetical protein DES53_107121 [Roseimicrobium gellanilyticum]|uniref:Uncharacterized protein n=1 Tax=Roseimicrobium gellanilyticum TaxID=748857 RepID=A0A366HGU4_9BACT|nr:hypothetical protein DES53_107121 [Roseimicrobium gellanilyticum]